MSGIGPTEEIVVKALDRSQADYARAIRGHVASLWRGKINLFTFVDRMIFSIDRGYRRAWIQGAGACGVKASDLTMSDLAEIRNMSGRDYLFVARFGAAIVEKPRSEGFKLGPHYTRTELWVNRYIAVRNRARISSCGEKALIWLFSPLKEHCTDCAFLHKKVYTAIEWQEIDIVPQSHKLECEGWRCGCGVFVTNKPITTGTRPVF